MKEGVIYDGVVLLGGIVDILVSEPNRPRAYGENIERLPPPMTCLAPGSTRR